MLKKDVIEHFGGRAQTARALRIHENSVRRWPLVLTDAVAYRVELASKGALKTNETLMSKKTLSRDNFIIDSNGYFVWDSEVNDER